jgi:UDP-N-acetylglucosamine 2-epimerase
MVCVVFSVMKVVSVVGARPQFIKLAPVSRELRDYVEEIILHTGQHYDTTLSETFFQQLHISSPDYNLEIGSGTHGYQTGAMLQGIEDILFAESPDMVLVYGDTNSTLAGALAAAKIHIPLAHVEAGLRSYNKEMPEEINRVLTDHCSNLLLCPTSTAVSNLHKEGIDSGVHLVGDVMYDALLYNRWLAKKTRILEDLSLKPTTYFVATLHRASNTDSVENLRSILEGFSRIDEPIIFSIHPRTQKVIQDHHITVADNIRLIEPLGYLEFLHLESQAKAILTDSGGVQKEAYILGIPCITLREETEWIETVENEWNTLVGTDPQLIVEKALTFRPQKKQRTLFGDGTASEKIVHLVTQFITDG